jgi:ribosome-associated protein
MLATPLSERDFKREFEFSSSRSSGPGGQNINKVSTRVELRFNIKKSALLDDTEKQTIFERLSNKINLNGELIIVSQSERSQLRNKEKAIDRFYQMLSKALMPKKKRLKTFPTQASKEKRLEEKRIQSLIKENRKKDYTN